MAVEVVGKVQNIVMHVDDDGTVKKTFKRMLDRFIPKELEWSYCSSSNQTDCLSKVGEIVGSGKRVHLVIVMDYQYFENPIAEANNRTSDLGIETSQKIRDMARDGLLIKIISCSSRESEIFERAEHNGRPLFDTVWTKPINPEVVKEYCKGLDVFFSN